MFSDTVTVIGINPGQNFGGGAIGPNGQIIPADPQVAVTIRLESTGQQFQISAKESDASEYTYGAKFALTLTPK